jgi:hypothetical protein
MRQMYSVDWAPFLKLSVSSPPLKLLLCGWCVLGGSVGAAVPLCSPTPRAQSMLPMHNACRKIRCGGVWWLGGLGLEGVAGRAQPRKATPHKRPLSLPLPPPSPLLQCMDSHKGTSSSLSRNSVKMIDAGYTRPRHSGRDGGSAMGGSVMTGTPGKREAWRHPLWHPPSRPHGPRPRTALHPPCLPTYTHILSHCCFAEGGATGEPWNGRSVRCTRLGCRPVAGHWRFLEVSPAFTVPLITPPPTPLRPPTPPVPRPVLLEARSCVQQHR